MSRINTNVSSLISQRVLTKNNNTLNATMERLSTGYRINRGADDPAGLIASENLRSQKAAISAAISNAERADQIANIAEGGLQEISTMLLELQGLIGQSANDAGLSAEEKAANQSQVDAIIQSIDRIATTTSFQGTKLLNGSFDYVISGQNSAVLDLEVNAAKIGNDNMDVQALVTQSAQYAGLFMSLGGTSINTSTTNPNLVFEVGGTYGAREFSFGSGTATSAMAAQINSYTQTIGASAVASNDGLYINSTEFGSDKFVSIDIVDHGTQTGSIVQMSAANNFGADAGTAVALSAVAAPIRDDGQDVGGSINGVTAQGKGDRLAINTDVLNVEVTLSTNGTAGVQNPGSISLFTITGGGAKFNLGPNADLTNQVAFGIKNVAARNLGSRIIDNPSDNSVITAANPQVSVNLADLGAGKELNVVDGDVTEAQAVVNEAIKEVASLRGRLGSFQRNVVGSTINALSVSLENTAAAESAIRDTDFAEATAELTRSQILVAASTNVLGIANNQPSNVLGLLG